MMIEYLTKLGDFINQLPERKYDLTNQEEIKEMLEDILDNQYVQLTKKLSEDILGFIDQMADVGINHIIFLVNRFKKISLLTHILSSLIIYISFYIFITIPIKKQLRAIDSLVNVTFSIPSSVYNTSPKLKRYEHFKLILITI